MPSDASVEEQVYKAQQLSDLRFASSATGAVIGQVVVATVDLE